MKKGHFIALGVAAFAVIGLLVYLNVRKDKQEAASNQEVATAEDVYLTTLTFREETAQAVRLPNSDKCVYIDQITAEDASNINSVLRHYEEMANVEIDTASEQAYIYTELQPKIMDWFNPEFDLVAAFSGIEYAAEADDEDARIARGLNKILAQENGSDVFYFRYNEEKDRYEMSVCYYLAGYSYSGISRITSSAEDDD